MRDVVALTPVDVDAVDDEALAEVRVDFFILFDVYVLLALRVELSLLPALPTLPILSSSWLPPLPLPAPTEGTRVAGLALCEPATKKALVEVVVPPTLVRDAPRRDGANGRARADDDDEEPVDGEFDS